MRCNLQPRHQSRLASFFNYLLLLVSSAMLIACGGGSSGGDPAANGAFLDSFGNTVSQSFFQDGGSGSDGGAGADGTAGDGAPIVGGTVKVSDVNGKTVSAITDSQGYYRVNVTNFTPPLIAQVTKPDKTVRYSFSVTPLKTNGFITINISGLTTVIASDVAIAGGKSGAADLTPQLVTANSGIINTSLNNLKLRISAVINMSGIPYASFNPLNVPFRPDHTGYDYVLDNTVVTTTPSGAAQVAISPGFQPTPAAYAGTYSGTFSGGDSGTFTATADSEGKLTVSGTSSGGGPFTGSGTVSANGDAYLSTGTTSDGAQFSGNISNGIFSGTWTYPVFDIGGTFSGKLQ